MQVNSSVYSTIWTPGTMCTLTQAVVIHLGCTVACLSTARHNDLDNSCAKLKGWMDFGLKGPRGSTVTNSSQSTWVRKTTQLCNLALQAWLRWRWILGSECVRICKCFDNSDSFNFLAVWWLASLGHNRRRLVEGLLVLWRDVLEGLKESWSNKHLGQECCGFVEKLPQLLSPARDRRTERLLLGKLYPFWSWLKIWCSVK